MIITAIKMLAIVLHSVSRFSLNYSSLSDEELRTWNRSLLSTRAGVEKCESWQYDTRDYHASAVKTVAILSKVNSVRHICNLQENEIKRMSCLTGFA